MIACAPHVNRDSSCDGSGHGLLGPRGQIEEVSRRTEILLRRALDKFKQTSATATRSRFSGSGRRRRGRLRAQTCSRVPRFGAECWFVGGGARTRIQLCHDPAANCAPRPRPRRLARIGFFSVCISRSAYNHRSLGCRYFRCTDRNTRHPRRSFAVPPGMHHRRTTSHLPWQSDRHLCKSSARTVEGRRMQSFHCRIRYSRCRKRIRDRHRCPCRSGAGLVHTEYRGNMSSSPPETAHCNRYMCCERRPLQRSSHQTKTMCSEDQVRIRGPA